MTYRLSNYEVESLLSFYRDIKKYTDLLNKERKDARYGVDSQIYAAFKLRRVSEDTKFSFLKDYFMAVEKAMKSWENNKSSTDHKAFRAIQMLFLNKRIITQEKISITIGGIRRHFRRDYVNKGIDIFKSYFVKQLNKLNYTQSDIHSVIVDDSFSFTYDRNLELMYYIVSHVAEISRNYFSDSGMNETPNSKVHSIKAEMKEFKEVS